tara:strand:- start:703 stop:942 length:240 start_codon:yes stop_codon:yes gene_type:complete
MNKPALKVWDTEKSSMTKYAPYDVYKIVVRYPGTDRELEFIGMDRGSCILQAEVAKQEGDELMLMQSEESITLYKKEIL